MGSIEDFFPNQSDVDLINERGIIPSTVEKESGIVLRIQAADSDVDRGNDQFQLTALQSMARLAIENKIPVLLAADSSFSDHSWLARNTKGLIFDAAVEDGKLIYKAYFPITESNKSIVEDIVAGLYNKVSVGFAIDPEDYVCSVCNIPLLSDECPHVIGYGKDVYAKIMNVSDNFEVSIVAVPMQSKAHIIGKGVIMSEQEEAKVVENTEVKNVEVELNPNDLLAAVKSFSTQLSNIEETLTKKMEDALKATKNSHDDKISNDTIQDNSVMEQSETKTEEQVVAAAEVPANTEVKESSVDEDRHAALMSCIKEMQTKLDSCHSKIDELHSKVDSYMSSKAVESQTAEVKSEVTETVAEVNSQEQAPATTKSTKSLEERVDEQFAEIKKTADELLWERLTLKQ